MNPNPKEYHNLRRKVGVVCSKYCHTCHFNKDDCPLSKQIKDASGEHSLCSHYCCMNYLEEVLKVINSLSA